MGPDLGGFRRVFLPLNPADAYKSGKAFRNLERISYNDYLNLIMRRLPVSKICAFSTDKMEPRIVLNLGP